MGPSHKYDSSFFLVGLSSSLQKFCGIKGMCDFFLFLSILLQIFINEPQGDFLIQNYGR